MKKREIYHLKTKLPEKLALSTRAKYLLFNGVPSQGFIGFVDIESGVIELVPAWNLHDEKKRIPLTYESKAYGVESRLPLHPIGAGGNGDAHILAIQQLQLIHRACENGYILGFGIFKGEHQEIKEYRNRSSSQNRYAISYNNELVSILYSPDHENVRLFLRCIPYDISHKIIAALTQNLNHSVINMNCDNFSFEEFYQQLSEQQLELITFLKLKLALDNDDEEFIYKYFLDRKFKLPFLLKAAILFSYDKNFLHRLVELYCDNAFDCFLKQGCDVTAYFDYPKQTDVRPYINKLLTSNIDINQYDLFGFHTIHYIAALNDTTILNMLKSIQNFDIHAKIIETSNPQVDYSMIGMTALHVAVIHGSFEVAEKILEWGVDVNTSTATGLTPLILAAATGNKQLVQLLINHGAQADNTMQVPKDYAYNTTQYFIPIYNGLDIKEFNYCGAALIAALCRHSELSLFIMDAFNISIDQVTIEQIGLVHIATFLGDEKLLLALIQRGARLDINCLHEPSNQLVSPLWLACHYYNPEIILILLEHIKKLNIKPHEFANCLHEFLKSLCEQQNNMNKANFSLEKFILKCLQAFIYIPQKNINDFFQSRENNIVNLCIKIKTDIEESSGQIEKFDGILDRHIQYLENNENPVIQGLNTLSNIIKSHQNIFPLCEDTLERKLVNE